MNIKYLGNDFLEINICGEIITISEDCYGNLEIIGEQNSLEEYESVKIKIKNIHKNNIEVIK